MRIFFNITMERLPCQFASVDVEDVMGTSVTNVTKEILKFKVAPDSGHRQEFYPEQPRDIEHEVLTPEEEQFHMEMPDELPQLGDKDFEHFVKTSDLVLVAFGAPWCPWSQRLEPVWRKTWNEVKTKPYGQHVRVARVDCTAQNAQQTCHKHHIHAFPTIRVYRHKQLHSHENYLGDRDSSAFITFIEEALPKHVQEATGAQAKDANALAPSKTEDHSLQGEGCQLTGSLSISRVPGNFRISARSDSHSFNTRVMNVSHHVDKLVFGAMVETGRLRHVMPIKERSSLFGVSFMMHQELATLKHYLKVVPYHYTFVDGETHHTYMYKANYNEYRPRKLEWYEGKADAHVDTQLVRRASRPPPPHHPPTRPPSTPSDACVARLRQVPNAVFHYDISPVMVVVNEETQSFASFVTKICAVIGGIYTVIGLVDNTIYHTGSALKKHL